MFDFTKHVSTRLWRLVTPQSQPIAGSAEEPTSTGGDALAVDHWARLDRFLIFGSERGTYYIRERQLTIADATAVQACIAEDGPRVVRRVTEISQSGRAPKNEPALFVLALAASAEEEMTRVAALAALPAVARTGAHLFHWMQHVKAFRGWGRGVRAAIGRWYTRKSPRDLAYQVLKYRSRDGWSHRDALRVAHPKAPSFEHDLLFRYAVQGWDGVAKAGATTTDIGGQLEAVQAIREMSPPDAARVIRIYGLTHGMVPAALLAHAEVWEALLASMPLTALLRNLGVMSKVGLLVAGADSVRTVASRLSDRALLRRSGVQPLGVLAALRTYARGLGVRGEGRWVPVSQVVDALDGAFYLSFENATATGKRVMVALDVSGSMGWSIHGMPFLSCREASAAIALVTAATEFDYRVVAFTDGGRCSTSGSLGSGLTPLAVSARQRLDDVVRSMSDLPFGAVDRALPMLEALKHRWPVDAFVVYTDSDTRTGDVHPVHALHVYRERMGIAAKLVIVAMNSNGFSIADPDDAGMLDVVGFDTTTPQVVSEFVKWTRD